MLDKYKTVLNEGVAEIIEKKSRFIATVKPVKSEEEAKSFIEELKKKYWNASHNVSAYQIGERNEVQRYSDDGEPQGTAGLPVLEVLKSEDIKNTVIVVTRYFGGTLLGTGGLVRAYGRCAKEGLYKAGITQFVHYKEYSVITEYTLSGKIQYEILQGGYLIDDTIYTDKVQYNVLAEESKCVEFVKGMIEVSGGKAEINELGERYISQDIV